MATTISRDNRTEFHFGLNFVVSPGPALSQKKYLELQQQFCEQGLTFGAGKRDDKSLVLSQESESPNLQLQVAVDPANPVVGQFLVIETKPKGSIELFTKKATACINAIKAVWPSPYQILKRDACVRQLYECRGTDHAFKFLWEERLQQDPTSIAPFKRKVLGGGIRFMFPPERPELPNVELRIESFLQNSKHLFIETQFAWNQPLAAGADFQVAALAREIYGFATKEVLEFIGAVE